MRQTHHLQLLGTSACHLCDEALEILQQTSQILRQSQNASLSWDEIEIADDDDLLAAYGLTIPVIRKLPLTQAQELAWPFDARAVLAFLIHTSDA